MYCSLSLSWSLSLILEYFSFTFLVPHVMCDSVKSKQLFRYFMFLSMIFIVFNAIMVGFYRVNSLVVCVYIIIRKLTGDVPYLSLNRSLYMELTVLWSTGYSWKSMWLLTISSLSSLSTLFDSSKSWNLPSF